MNAENGDPVDLSIEAVATDWFVRLRDDELCETDRLAFTRWHDADPGHAEAYATIAEMWAGMSALPRPAPIARARFAPAVAVPRPRHPRRWALAAVLVAAPVLALAAPDLWMALTADARSGIGEVRALTLADGTRVILDADSAIDVAIDADRRHVRLRRGRAWFAVAHEARAFTVAVGAGQVRDIGTAFVVTRRGEGGEVAVTQGQVELTVAGGRAIRLSAGDAGRFAADGRVRPSPAMPDPRGWQRGRMQFVDARVGDVLDDLGRYGAGVPISLDAAIARRRVTGVVDTARPAHARDTILARAGATAWRIGPYLVVTAR